MRTVTTGLERWLAGDDPLERGRRLGLLAHAASIDREGIHAVRRVLDLGRHRLERLFGPEHGLWGVEQDMEGVGSAVDPASRLPVVSLYGHDAESLRPRAEHLDGLDAVVCDVQDVGSRYYTFVYTVAHVMEVAGERGIPVVVLDRPNPIGGAVEGPVLDPALSSFVGRYPVPVRHGLTVGEMAGLFRDRFGIACDLHVVPMEGWSPERWFRETGLPWVPPSPNMPTPETAHVYPGACLVEGTNLSEGRGTTTPFELAGAPWIDAERLASDLRPRAAGARVRAARFRPMFGKHAGRPCGGVHVIPHDRDRFRPFATWLDLLLLARRQDRSAFGWRTEPYEFERDRLAIDLLLGRADLRARLEADEPPAAWDELWRDEVRAFRDLRRPHLLYGELEGDGGS
jgi:uncharacterized protein YbbC (DUF1343 family)